MKQNIQLSTVLILLVITQTINAQKCSFEQEPKWVKTIDIPAESFTSKYNVASGFYTKLADMQVFLEENAYYNRQVINVVSYSGITNASQLAITYDTSYQQLKIHHLYVWRKGQKIDRTKDMSLEILNNENSLNRGIYKGSITAYDNLDDIRKDDLIDFAYTLTGANPIFENEKYLFLPLEGMNPIDLYSVRVLFPKEKEYSYHCVGCDSIKMSSTELNGYREIEIKNEHVKAIKLEDNMPSWMIPFKYFTLSSCKSWIDVNRWAQDVFVLNKEPVFDNVFNEIFTGEETTDEKINKIINYVQDDIRYMGIESGIGSIKPVAPEQVIKQRFGDCKDKSLLMVSLLKKIGIERAYPALVNTILQAKIESLNPSNQVFNHCIVSFYYGDKRYWVDPTVTLQGGDFKDLYIKDYGKALIIGLPGDTLSTIPQGKTKAGTNITEELTVNSFTEPAILKVFSYRYGFEADNRRAALEFFALDDLMKQITKDMRLIYPVVNEIGEPIISDDIKNNSFSMTYNYEVDGFWKDSNKDATAVNESLLVFRYEPQILYQYLNVTSCEDRKFDFDFIYPQNLNYRVIFHFPKDLMVNDDYEEYDNEAFCFRKKIEQLSSNTIRLDYSFNLKSRYIMAADYKKICEQKNSIANNLPLIIYFVK